MILATVLQLSCRVLAIFLSPWPISRCTTIRLLRSSESSLPCAAMLELSVTSMRECESCTRNLNTPAPYAHMGLVTLMSHKTFWRCHVIAHGDEEVRLILIFRGESALSSSQKVTVKRECGSRRGDQVFALSDLRSPDIGRGKREKPNNWLGPQMEVGLPSPQRK